MTEIALLDSARTGEERAFRELVEPYRHELEVHCYRMLGSPHDAEDIVQETLLHAWRGLERFERRASVRTWLYRIATNACLDELERRPRRLEPVQPYPDERHERASGPIADPAACYALREGMELAFLTAIRQLPGRQRAILIFRDVLGWSAQEVADQLDSTVAAVNSALQRARATIDAELAARPPAPAGGSERELLRRYVEVWERADIDGFVALLHEDAVLSMPPQPAIAGAGAIAAFWFSPTGPACRALGRAIVEPTSANGRPAVRIYTTEADGTRSPHGVLVLHVDGDRIAGFEAHLDPRLVPLFEAASDSGH